MVIMNPGVKMGDQEPPRIDTMELKLYIERKLGSQKAVKYFNVLNKYFSLKLNKSEFDKLCIGLLGRGNISLHNGLLRAITRNVCVPKTPPMMPGKGGQALLNMKFSNGYQRSSPQSPCRDVFPQYSGKGRTPTLLDRRSKDRQSPLGPHGKPNNAKCDNSMSKIQEQQSAIEILSLGSKPPVEVNSVEEGEEVEQDSGSPGTYSRSHVRAPFGVSLHMKETRKALCHGSSPFSDVNTCYNKGELPDSSSLRAWLEPKLNVEGLDIPTDCVNLLNNGVDVFLKRLLKPCLDLTASQHQKSLSNKVYHQVNSTVNGTWPLTIVPKSSRTFSMSMTDFQVAMESNPRVLGEDWPVLLEKICFHASQVYMDG